MAWPSVRPGCQAWLGRQLGLAVSLAWSSAWPGHALASGRRSGATAFGRDGLRARLCARVSIVSLQRRVASASAPSPGASLRRGGRALGRPAHGDRILRPLPPAPELVAPPALRPNLRLELLRCGRLGADLEALGPPGIVLSRQGNGRANSQAVAAVLLVLLIRARGFAVCCAECGQLERMGTNREIPVDTARKNQ